MSNQYSLYDDWYYNLRGVEELFDYRDKAAIGLSTSRGTFMFRLIGGRVRVQFAPVLRRAKKRRPGKRMRPKRKKLIVGKVIFTEWAPLDKKISSLRELENYLTRYNKKLKKTNRL